MDSQIKQQGNTTFIEGGTTAGTNLFHILKDLSIAPDRAFCFNNSSDSYITY